MERLRNKNDEEHNEAFGEHVNILHRDEINWIRNNDPRRTTFILEHDDAEKFSDLALELLGLYIAENEHLEHLRLEDLQLMDDDIYHLFLDLTWSISLKELKLGGNRFGLNGVRSMLPFLKNSPNLVMLSIGDNNHFNTECFSLLIGGLHGGSIEELILRNCSIDDISALLNYMLPHLKSLDLENNNIRTIPSIEEYTTLEKLLLEGNNIGMQGCKSIAKLLQNQSSRLRVLDLNLNDTGDAEAEILINSLEHNVTLVEFTLGGNKFEREHEKKEYEHYLEVFEEYIYIFHGEDINRVRNNDPELTTFVLRAGDAGCLSDLAWELLGRYIAQNEHLECLRLDDLGLADANMSHLFKNLTRSMSLTDVCISHNDFGVGGIQSMVSFLKYSPIHLLSIGENDNFNTECFDLLVSGLHGGSIEHLHVEYCSIEDVMALERYSLPELRTLILEHNSIRQIPSLEEYTSLERLYLNNNVIGEEGCRSIATLLQSQSSRLRVLNLNSNDIGDVEAEILANSLENNNTLKGLNLGNNNITADGKMAFSKVMKNDSESTEMTKHVPSPLAITNGSDASGQENGVMTQLDSSTGMELCRLQDIESPCNTLVATTDDDIDSPCNTLVAKTDDALLPNILALADQKHRQTELYRMITDSAPHLASVVHKIAALTERMDEKSLESAALHAECADTLEALNDSHARLMAFLDGERLEVEQELESIRRSMADMSILSIGRSNDEKRLSL